MEGGAKAKDSGSSRGHGLTVFRRTLCLLVPPCSPSDTGHLKIIFCLVLFILFLIFLIIFL